MSPVRGRVNGGRPEGGQYATVEHSDTVVTLSPTAERIRSIDAFRSRQLIWKEQQDFLDNQRHIVDRQVRESATSSAAIEILEVLPRLQRSATAGTGTRSS